MSILFPAGTPGQTFNASNGVTYTYDGTAGVWTAGGSGGGSFLPLTGGTMTGAIVNVVGSAATPSLSFTGDLDTGFYSPGAGIVGISNNGTGNVFVDASGRVLVGTSSARNTTNTIEGTSFASSSLVLATNQNSTASSYLQFVKSRGTSVGSVVSVSNNDLLGGLEFFGADGSGLSRGGRIECYVDGTPGANDMPGRIVLSTTADGQISPTEAMRINSAQQVLIGTTTPAPIDQFNNQSLAYFATSSNTRYGITLETGTGITNHLIFRRSGGAIGGSTLVSNGDQLGEINFRGCDGSTAQNAAVIQSLVDGAPSAGVMPGALRFLTTPAASATSVERMRISSTGAVYVSFSAGTTQPMHSFASIGGTAANSSTLADQWGGLFLSASVGFSNTAQNGSALVLSASTGASTGPGNLIRGFGSGAGTTLVFQVQALNGTVTNSTGSYTTISDVKLKENIVDAGSQWDDVKSIRIRNWNFKEETGYPTHRQIGPIAQELEEVCPNLVSDTIKDGSEEEGNLEVTKSVNQSVLYMKAVKALQEAMERIEELEARLDAAGI